MLQFFKEQRSVSLGLFIDKVEWWTYPYVQPKIAQAVFDGNSQLAWLLWGTAFMVSPLGNMLFGSIADTVGRKKALIASSLLLSVGTVCQGLTPPVAYVRVGWMVAWRCIQGIGYGGKFTVSNVYLAEVAPRSILSMARAAMVIPQALAFVVVSGAVTPLYACLSPSQMVQWGWRVPFLLSGLLGVFPMLLFMAEAPEPSAEPVTTPMDDAGSPAAAAQEAGFLELVQENYPRLGLCIAGLSLHYTCEGLGFAYLKAWLTQWCGYSEEGAGFVALTAAVVYCPIVFGLLVVADTVGICKTSLGGAVFSAAFSIPLFMPVLWKAPLLAYGPSGLMFVGLMSGRSLCIVWAADCFPQHLRARAFGVCSTVGMSFAAVCPALCAGTAMGAGFVGLLASLLSGMAMGYSLVSHHMCKHGQEGGCWMRVAHLRDEPY